MLEITEVDSKALIADARKHFAGLKDMGALADDVAKNIQIDLSKAGVDAAALDPTGKKSAAEMVREIEARVREANINQARSHFSNLENAGQFADETVTQIQKELLRGHAGLDVLDPEGKKSAIEMAHALEEKVKQANIGAAREHFAFLADAGPQTDAIVTNIQNELRRAGVDAAALDPEGRKSAQEMSGEIAQRAKQAYITDAREHFADLPKIGNLADSMVETIRHDLQRAGVDAAALDPQGTKSAKEMNREIDENVKKAFINDAREHFADLQKMGHFADAMVETIQKDLKRAGVDAAALDPEGKKSARQMNQELKFKADVARGKDNPLPRSIST